MSPLNSVSETLIDLGSSHLPCDSIARMIVVKKKRILASQEEPIKRSNYE